MKEVELNHETNELVETSSERRIVCNECSRTYTDEGSINMALNNADEWRKDCERDGVQPTGLFPCPEILCSGEMVLKEIGS